MVLDLTEAQDIKKRWQEYAKYTKKIFRTQIITMVLSLTQSQTSWNVKSSGPQEVITTSKTRGGDVIPVELFQVLNDDAVKVLHSIGQQIWKTQQWSQDWKRSVFIPIPKKGKTKECSNYHTIALISHTSKVMLKILQATLQQYMNHELPDVQFGFRIGRGTRDEIANICWIIKKAREMMSSRKTSTSALLTMPKPLTVLNTDHLSGNTRPPNLPPEISVCRSRSNSWSWTWNNIRVPNQEKCT